MQHARPNRLRRAVAFAVLAALLGLVSLTVTQCTMVGDNLTGVGFTRSAPTTCSKSCLDLYDLLFKLEAKRHQAETDLCNAIPDVTERQVCKDLESDRHVAAKQKLTGDKQACTNGCHHQGAGSAG